MKNTKEFKKMNQLHTKKLYELCKENSASPLNTANMLKFFIEQLQFMQDYYTLTYCKEVDQKLTTINAALTEITAYNKATAEQTKILADGILKKIPTEVIMNMPATQEKLKEAGQHWDAFWFLVRSNLMIWGELNEYKL